MILRARIVFPVSRPVLENGAVVISGNRITAVNQLMGASPQFRMQLGNNYAGNNMALTLYAAIPTKMSWDFKNEDFTVPDFEFSAFTDSLGRFFDWSSTL